MNELPAGTGEIAEQAGVNLELEEAADGGLELEETADGLIAAYASESALAVSSGSFSLSVSPDSFLIAGSTAGFAIETESQYISSNDSATYNNDNAAFPCDSAALSNSSEPLSGGNTQTASRRAAENAGLVVTISARDAVDLRALYCELRYDAARYTPVSVEHLAWDAGGEHHSALDDDRGAAIPGRHLADSTESRAGTPAPLAGTPAPLAGTPAPLAGTPELLANGIPLQPTSSGDMLTLEVLSDPGVVHIGQVLANWNQRAGLNGDAKLARVHFSQQAYSCKLPSASKLYSEEVRPFPLLDITERTISWSYRYPADYDQNGLVNASDLTPLGRYLGADDPLTEFPSYIRGLLDGNGDGRITLHDITPIGQHWGEGVEEWRLYASFSPGADYPAANDAAAAITPVAVWPFAAHALGDAAQEQLHFALPLPTAADGLHFWLRPALGGYDGTPSVALEFDTHLDEDIPVVLQPRTFLYGGTVETGYRFRRDPEQVYVDVLAENAHDLHIFSARMPYNLERFRFVTGTSFGLLTAPNPGAPYSIFYPLGLGAWAATPPNLGPSFTGSKVLFELTFRYTTLEDSAADLAPFAPGRGRFEQSLKDAGAHIELESGELTWYHNQLADYSQDGVVNNEDLLFIGLVFNDYVEAEDIPQSLVFFLDGTDDGLITIFDINPIGIQANSTVDGYHIYATSDWNNLPEKPDERNVDDWPDIVPVGYVDFSEAQGDWLSERLCFKFFVPKPVVGKVYWIVPTCQGQDGVIGPGAYLEVPLPEDI